MTQLAYSRRLDTGSVLLDELKAMFHATPLGILLAIWRTRR